MKRHKTLLVIALIATVFLLWYYAPVKQTEYPSKDVLVDYGKDYCDYNGLEYLYVIPIQKYWSIKDFDELEYFFHPVDGDEVFFADTLIKASYDTSFVLITRNPSLTLILTQ